MSRVKVFDVLHVQNCVWCFKRKDDLVHINGCFSYNNEVCLDFIRDFIKSEAKIFI